MGCVAFAWLPGASSWVTLKPWASALCPASIARSDRKSTATKFDRNLREPRLFFDSCLTFICDCSVPAVKSAKLQLWPRNLLRVQHFTWEYANVCTLNRVRLGVPRDSEWELVYTIRGRAILTATSYLGKGHYGTTQDISGFMDASGQQLSKPRLDSWKEIAGFFGRDERTVKRWEKERALPVHRVPGGTRGGVFAYATELSQWLKDPKAAAVESSQLQSYEDTSASSADASREVEPVIPELVSATPTPVKSSKFQVVRISGLLLAILLGLFVLKDQIRRPSTSAAATNIAPSAYRPNPEAEEFYLKGR